MSESKMIMLPREVVEQAMSALEFSETQSHRHQYDVEVSALAALSAALDQPQGEQEPFAWINPRALEWGTRQSEKVVKLTCEAQPEYDFTEPLYTRPQPKPLTDEAVLGVAKSIEIQFDSERLNEQIDDILAFARAIERAHGIGGNL